MVVSGEQIHSINEGIMPRIRKRYVLNSITWPKRNLQWSFRDPQHLIKRRVLYKRVKNLIENALNLWSNASSGAILFEDISVSNKCADRVGDLDIFFAKYDHGDKELFDGPGGVIAHSTYPLGGTIHFDGSELWSTTGHRNFLDLRYVALHEIGHVLGLRHSSVEDAVMNPFYSEKYKETFELGDDDIKGIRKLYKIER